ncbi:MAG: 3-hydroxyacyl-ACP dehydratase FabZ [Nitrospinota bacterium]
MLDSRAIREILPHRFPFLLVDRILELESGRRAVGLKNVTIDEPFFQGHFPAPHPLVMPGVLIIEAMAQVGGVLVIRSMELSEPLLFFTGIDRARFRRQVVPGDQLRLEVEVLRRRGSHWRMTGRALVDGELAAEAQLQAMVVDGPD